MALKWWRRLLDKGKAIEREISLEELFGKASIDYYARNLAFSAAVNLISVAISKCEFRTFEGGQEIKGEEYYRWNIEPNRNQSSSEFLRSVIERLYANNECLVILDDEKNMLVADSYTEGREVLRGRTFTGITVGDVSFKRTFQMEDVFFFRLGNENVRRLINGLYESYGELLAHAMKTYQVSNGERGTLKIDGMDPGDEAKRNQMAEFMNAFFRPYFQSANAVVPLPNGYTYTKTDTRTTAAANTRDIRAIVDDTFDFTARALCIPPILLRGEVANTSWATDSFLTFCIDPLADLLQEEIIRKKYRQKGFERGDHLMIDTHTIKHIDLLAAAGAVDKLISSGTFTINQLRKAIGESEIDADWANAHWMTRNYQLMTDAVERVEENGG